MRDEFQTSEKMKVLHMEIHVHSTLAIVGRDLHPDTQWYHGIHNNMYIHDTRND